MRRLVLALPLVALLATLTAPAVLGAPSSAGCPSGPRHTGAADIGAFVPMTVSDMEAAIEATGGDPAQAAGEFALHNTNGDAWVCVMTQVLPNDASGATTWFVAVDNLSRRR